MTRTFTLTLDEATAERLEEAAAIAGLSVPDFIAHVVTTRLSPTGVSEEAALFDGAYDTDQHHVMDKRTDAARKWQREQAAMALADYDRTGISYSLDEVFASLDERRGAVADAAD